MEEWNELADEPALGGGGFPQSRPRTINAGRSALIAGLRTDFAVQF